MPTITLATLVEPSTAAANRRQPLRQARTNPSRSALAGCRTYGALPSTGGPSDERATANPDPGFFPGITHFTDAITALPKEMVRHHTMLKEVDAKIYGPEDALRRAVTEVLNAPTSVPPQRMPAGEPAVEPFDLVRRQRFLNVRLLMSEMLVTLDEKIHVLSTATDALEKHLARCESSWPEIQKEISEEARWGNLHHWAYTDKTVEKKAATSERPRREGAANHHHASVGALAAEGELAALRSEARQEALKRRRVQQHLDSDFDDPRSTKKSSAPAKAKKPTDVAPTTNGAGMGIASAGPSSHKRRRVEKPATGGVAAGSAMERSLSAVFGANGPRSRAASPRSTPGTEASRKRGRGGNVANNVTGRRRNGTNASTTMDSPLTASSPVLGTFGIAAKAAPSLALGAATMQRQPSARGRQNSTQSIPQAIRAPSTASTKQTNGGGAPKGNAAEAEKTAAAKVAAESKALKREDTIPTEQAAEVRTGSRAAPKREEGASTGHHRPPSISTGSRPNGKASKTSTPVNASFPDPPAAAAVAATATTRPRSNRNNYSSDSKATSSSNNNNNNNNNATSTGTSRPAPPVKRSHKKGAGIAAQLAAAEAMRLAQVAREERGAASGSGGGAGGGGGGGGAGGETGTGDGSDDEDGDGPLYCYCNGPSYGEMVGCDGQACKREWFHLSCVGLLRPPSVKAKWYCGECKDRLGI